MYLGVKPRNNGINLLILFLRNFVVQLHACIPTLHFGLFFAWPSPSIPELTSENSTIKLTSEEASYLPVLAPLAMAISAPFFYNIMDKIGRRLTIVLVAIPQFAAWALIATATTPFPIYLSRILTGIGDALNLSVCPAYIAEIAEPRVRGTWGYTFPVISYVGQFVVNLIGCFLNVKQTAMVFMAIPVLQVFLAALMPESPYYLIMTNRAGAARKSLQMLRWKTDVEEELGEMTKAVQRQISQPGTFYDLFKDEVNRKALFITSGLRSIQVFSGFAALIIYTQYIFQKSKVEISNSTLATAFTGLMLTVIFLSVFLVRTYNRKTVMTLSCVGSGTVLLVVTSYLFTEANVQTDISHLRWIVISGIFMFIVTFSPGQGMVPMLMLGELFPTNIKSKAMCALCVVFGCCILSCSKIFYFLSQHFGMHVPFAMFTIYCFVGAWFSYRYVPDTRGKTLEEIQQFLRNGSKECAADMPDDKTFGSFKVFVDYRPDPDIEGMY